MINTKTLNKYTINIQNVKTLNIFNTPKYEEKDEELDDDICQCGHNHDYICEDCESGDCDQHDYNLEPLEELK